MSSGRWPYARRIGVPTATLTEVDLKMGATGVRGLADSVLRHRKLVVLFWGLVLIAGIALAGRTTDRLTIDFSLPGQPGSETAQKIEQAFGNGGNTNPFVVTVTMPQGQMITGHENEVTNAFAAIGSAVPNVRVVDESNTGDRAFRTADDRTAYALVFWRFNPSPTQTILTDPIRAAGQAAAPAGATDRCHRRGCPGRRRLGRQRPRRPGRDTARCGWRARCPRLRLRIVPCVAAVAGGGCVDSRQRS